MIGGVLNVIYGIAAIGNSHFFVANTHYVFADLRAWGWVALILGVLQLFASVSLFAGGTYGRWFGIIGGSLAAIAALLYIAAYPLWSFGIFALSLWNSSMDSWCTERTLHRRTHRPRPAQT